MRGASLHHPHVTSNGTDSPNRLVTLSSGARQSGRPGVLGERLYLRWDDDLGMNEKNSISDLTRRNIFDYMTLERVAWAGRLEETQFIVRVWPNAADLPSYDMRYAD